MSKFIQIKYNPVWANIYILVGVFSALIFWFGALFLNQNKLLLFGLAALGPIYIGFEMRKNNYALVSLSEIQVFGLLGKLKKEYKTDSKSFFSMKKNKLFLHKNGSITKVNMNKWFVNQYDWKRAIGLFELDETIKITKHLIDD